MRERAQVQEIRTVGQFGGADAGGLPVLDGGRLVGIVSIGDMVKATIADQAHTIAQLHTYIAAKYPA